MTNIDNNNERRVVDNGQWDAPQGNQRRGFSFAQLRNLFLGDKNQGLSPTFLKEQEKAIQAAKEALKNFAQIEAGASALRKSLEAYKTSAPADFEKTNQIIKASLDEARLQANTIVTRQAPAISRDNDAAQNWVEKTLAAERGNAQRVTQPQLLDKFASQLNERHKNGLSDASQALYVAKEADLRTRLAEAALDAKIKAVLGDTPRLANIETAAKNLEAFLSQTQPLRPSAVPKDYSIEKSLEAANELIGDQRAIAAQVERDRPRSLEAARQAISEHAKIVQGALAYNNELAPVKGTNNESYEKTDAALAATVMDSLLRTERMLKHHLKSYEKTPELANSWARSEFLQAFETAKTLPQERLKEQVAVQLKPSDRAVLLQLSSDVKKTAESSLPTPGTKSELKDGALSSGSARQQDNGGDELIARIRAAAQRQPAETERRKPLEPDGKRSKELVNNSSADGISPVGRGTQSPNRSRRTIPAAETSEPNGQSPSGKLRKVADQTEPANKSSPGAVYRYKPGTPTQNPEELARRATQAATVVDKTPENFVGRSPSAENDVRSTDSLSAGGPSGNSSGQKRITSAENQQRTAVQAGGPSINDTRRPADKQTDRAADNVGRASAAAGGNSATTKGQVEPPSFMANAKVVVYDQSTKEGRASQGNKNAKETSPPPINGDDLSVAGNEPTTRVPQHTTSQKPVSVPMAQLNSKTASPEWDELIVATLPRGSSDNGNFMKNATFDSLYDTNLNNRTSDRTRG